MDGKPGSIEFDPDALREKYRQERERRLRPDRADQYLEMAGQFAHFADEDPYVEPGFQRPPVREDIDIAIVGGGFSGLLAAARLTEQGVTTFRIIEAGGDFGGTWYWNRYPGAQCDTESYCYLPLLEELDYMPKEKYSFVTRSSTMSQRIGRALRPVRRGRTSRPGCSRLDWDETRQRWHLSTNRGDDLRARFVVMALGTASRAKLPGIPGHRGLRRPLVSTPAAGTTATPVATPPGR